MDEINKRTPEPLEEGMMWRSKLDPDGFSSELYIGTGDSIDNYDKVSVEVYEQYLIEQEEKMKTEMML